MARSASPRAKRHNGAGRAKAPRRTKAPDRSTPARIEPLSFTEVLLLRNPSCADLVPALWAALDEVRQFYQWPKQESEFRRLFASPRVPAAIRRDLTEDQIIPARRLDDIPWDTAAGRPAGTFRSNALGNLARKIVGADDILLLVTDFELTPPSDWRYIIWDACENGVVISVAPTDPRYWGADTPARIQTVKHRVRTAALNATGQFLGLEACEKPDCLLFGNIESVSILDIMVLLGPEHRIPERTGKGYARDPRDPGRMQRIVAPESIMGTSSGDDE